MKKLFKYLFKRPNVKIGDKLYFRNRVCKGTYFSWEDGLWYIKCEDIDITYGLEQFYRDLNK